MQSLSSINRQRGMTLIEVLVTVFILTVGLLGMAGLQSRLQQSEMESYQRSQALLLLNDMANRIAANRNDAGDYIFNTGMGDTCDTTPTGSVERDKAEWCLALQGAGETNDDTKVGAMIGGRGCVESLGGNEYLVTVAWQGLIPLAAPPSGVSCGANSYDGANESKCVNDRCRRVVTTLVRVGSL